MFWKSNEEVSMDCSYCKDFLKMKKLVEPLPKPAIAQLKERLGADPFLILIATLLSLRARDTKTLPLAALVYQKFPTPRDLALASEEALWELLRPIGFYRVKGRVLLEVSKQLLIRYNGVVPHGEQELLSLPGVGRKTANLVRAEAFGIPALCVDTHVHRIANHLGWVSTKSPEETELALMKIFPSKYWIEINRVLVVWGQQICRPLLRNCVCQDFLK